MMLHNASLQKRLLEDELCQWEGGETLRFPRNRDGFAASVYIRRLEGQIDDLQREIATLDQLLEAMNGDAARRTTL